MSSHHPRPLSRQQSTSASTSGDSWSMPGPASTRTSVWSDDATAIPPTPVWSKADGAGGVRTVESGEGERPLIDLESDLEGHKVARGLVRMESMDKVGEGKTPGEKLRELLHIMEGDLRQAVPVVETRGGRGPSPVTRDAQRRTEERQAVWRQKRSIILQGGEAAQARAEGSEALATEDEVHDGRSAAFSPPSPGTEEESPPSPPMRMSNPYQQPRRVSEGRTPTPPSLRAAMHASSSRSPSPTPQTALRNFIASHPSPPAESSRASRISRKGKERADPISSSPHPLTPAPRRRNTSPRVSVSSADSEAELYPPTVRRPAGRNPPTTPRRWSVELAPDDSAQFAQDAGGLEMRGEVELDLDLDEGLSGRVLRWETETEESGTEGDWPEELNGGHEEGHHSQSFIRTARTAAVPIPSTHVSDRSMSKQEDVGRLRRLLSRSQLTEDSSLPALPEPETSAEEEIIDTLSSRRAVLFRSTSKSPRASQSPSIRKEAASTSPVLPRKASRSSFAMTPSPERKTPKTSPEQLSQALSTRYASPRNQSARTSESSRSVRDLPATSAPTGINAHTPHRNPRANPNQTLGANPHATPHPPGWLASSPDPPSSGLRGRNVRFSPLRRTDADWSVSESKESEAASTGEGSVSVHRLRVSPRKVMGGEGSEVARQKGSALRRSTGKGKGKEDGKEKGKEEGDTSFSGRLAALSRAMVGRPSTALADAQLALDSAARTSALAAERVEQTQRKWLDALAALQAQSSMRAGAAVGVVRRGWGWGTWAWWVVVEMLLMWGVFRVTLDYAASYPALDPFHPSTVDPYAISIPLPSAVSAFVIPHRGSANFFDLVASSGLWGKLEAVGLGPGGSVVWGAVGGMGAGGGMRMLGGVPT